MKTIILLFSVFFSLLVQAQSYNSIRNIDKENIYNAVYNNIISYKIHLYFSNSTLTQKDIYINNFYVCRIIPDSGFYYDLRFSSSEFTYPDTNYILFKYIFNYNTQYHLDSTNKKWAKTNDCKLFSPLDNTGLFLYHKRAKTLTFIAGELFKGDFLRDFFSRSGDTMLFISLRYFNYKPEAISKIGQDYTFYSGVTNKRYRVSQIDMKYLDSKIESLLQ